MKIYGLKNCDTCRKATKALDAELYDVRDTPLSKEQLERFYEVFGQALLNTRSTTWRSLDEAARSVEPIALLQQHPTLMKRPVIERGDELFLGWSKDVQAEL
ncbi:MAG: arsenate reductase, partial [bacterium]|nr:arsenate reductase [bacterium]